MCDVVLGFYFLHGECWRVGPGPPSALRPMPGEPDGYPDRVACRLQRDGGRPARAVGGGSGGSLVPAVGVTPANLAEAQVADQITADLDAQA